MNFLQRIFGPRPKPLQAQRVELLSGNTGFSTWSGDAYGSDIYRGAVDAIARNAAKLKGGHVVRYGDHVRGETDRRLDRLLQVQPNPYMSAYDVLYKLVTHYYLYNNAFAYLQWDGWNLTGVWPIQANTVDFVADDGGAIYCRFWFRNGQTVTLPYADIIHLRRHFNDNDLLGDDNSAIFPALELAHAQNEGIVKGIQTSANIRGLLKFTQIMAPDKLKEEKERFISDYLTINNAGGVVATDQKMEYVPIDVKPAIIDHEQIGAAKRKIHDYLGISEAVVTSSYTEDQWAAFYESTIEPLALQLSLEFTRKIFTDRERAFGNEILFESGRLQFSSNKTKIELISQLMPYGLLTVNQALEILNLPTVQDGDRRLQTLNVIDAASAKNYQLEQKLKTEAVKELSENEGA